MLKEKLLAQKSDAEKQNSPNVLEDIEKFSSQIQEGSIGGDKEGLNVMVNQAVTIMLGIAVILAVFMIIFAGFQYMTSGDNASARDSAKKRIQAAFGGLLLAIASVLILNTINPGLTTFTTKFVQVEQPELADGKFAPSIQYLNTVADSSAGAQYLAGRGGEYDRAIEQAFLEAYRNNPDALGSVTHTNIRIDTDGINPPPFYDPHYQSQTSLPGLDANVDHYVVVPIGSTIPLGTKVRLYNETTGLQTYAIVGDRGPTKNGGGEMSLAAARAIGAWKEGDGNTVSGQNHRVQHIFLVE